MTKNTALLIPISEHNVAQLYNCVSVSVNTVILMASARFVAQRQRFQHVLQHIQPLLNIRLLDLPDDAEDYAAMVQFAHTHLQPLQQDFRLELNGTGGTKVIPLAFIDCGYIEAVYYKGLRHNQLQRWQPGQPHSVKTLPLSQKVDAQMALDLYATSNRQHRPAINPFHHKPTALQLAAEIWQLYAQPNSVMCWLAQQLASTIWSQSNPQRQTIAFELPSTITEQPASMAWLTQLAEFSDASLSLQGATLWVETSNKKKHPSYQFKRWLSGEWLELLVQHWLAEKIPAQQCLMGIRPSSSGLQGDLRELDFVCFHHTAGYVIETKVTTEPGQSANKMVQQLASLAENFGKLQKILLVSPLFFQSKTDEHSLEQFRIYCQGHDVRLCHDKASLLAHFR